MMLYLINVYYVWCVVVKVLNFVCFVFYLNYWMFCVLVLFMFNIFFRIGDVFDESDDKIEVFIFYWLEKVWEEG